MSNFKSQTAIANAQDYDTTFTNSYEADQTNATILAPTSGTKLAIKGVYIGSAASSGSARLIIDSNTVVTIFFNAQPGYIPLNITGLRNSALKITASSGQANYYVHVNYREE